MKRKPYLLFTFFLILSSYAKAQSARPREDTSITALASKLHLSPQQALKAKQHLDGQKVAIQKRFSEEFKQKESSFNARAVARLSDSLKRKQAASMASAQKAKMQQVAFSQTIDADRKIPSKREVIAKPRGL